MMQSMDRPTLVGIFSSRSDAEKCVDELHRVGFRDDQIGFMMADDTRRMSDTDTITHKDEDVSAGEGAITGAVTGGLVGAATAFFIPAVGPVLAGGILAATLTGVIAGAATGGIAAALMDFGVSEDDARYYEGEFRSGRTLVTVKTEGHYDEAYTIMQRYGAYFDQASSDMLRRRSA